MTVEQKLYDQLGEMQKQMEMVLSTKQHESMHTISK